MSSHHWRNGEPTDFGISTFTEGDCWILAYELWRETGWPIYRVGPTSDPDGAQHYVIKAPGDRYLDVIGVHTRHALLKAWEEKSLIRADDSLYEICFESKRINYSDFPDSWRRASTMAKRLLEKYGVRA